MPEQREEEAREHSEALPTPNLTGDWHSQTRTRVLVKSGGVDNRQEAVSTSNYNRYRYRHNHDEGETHMSCEPSHPKQGLSSIYSRYRQKHEEEQASTREIKLSTPVQTEDSDKRVIVTSIQRDSPSFSTSLPFNFLWNTSRASISETSHRTQTDAHLGRSTSSPNISQQNTPQSAHQQPPSQPLTPQQYLCTSIQQTPKQQTPLQQTLIQQTSQQQTPQQQTPRQQLPQQQTPRQQSPQQQTPRQQSPQQQTPRQQSLQQQTPQQQVPQQRTSRQHISQNSRRQQKRKRRSLIESWSEDVDNYVGNKPIHELLKFIESN